MVSVFCLGIFILVLGPCYAYYFHSSLLMNAIVGSTSLSYGSCIQLSNRSDRTNQQPSCEHEAVNEMQFSDRQLHLTGRVSLSIRTGLYCGFFRSCQLERTRNVHVCLLYCATRFPVVNECNFRIDKSTIRIVVKIIQSYGSNESTNLLST